MADRTDMADQEQTIQFKELKLPIGTLLTLETVSPVRKLVVHLIGFVEGRSLLVSAPLRDGKEIFLEKGSVLAVRLLEGKRVCAFESHVLYRSIQPYSYYHLAYPDAIEALQIRNSERISTELPATIDSDFDIVGDWPKSAVINDLSKTGARMVSEVSLGQFGHELLIEFDAEMSGMTKQVQVAGVIRNIEKEENALGEISFIVGVQFLEMLDDARLALANFIYEHDKKV